MKFLSDEERRHRFLDGGWFRRKAALVVKVLAMGTTDFLQEVSDGELSFVLARYGRRT